MCMCGVLAPEIHWGPVGSTGWWLITGLCFVREGFLAWGGGSRCQAEYVPVLLWRVGLRAARLGAWYIINPREHRTKFLKSKEPFKTPEIRGRSRFCGDYILRPSVRKLI